ncbi:hypothetical protein Py04_0817 [Pyrococcus sp. ST04]|nr:hypothetical protein Py04_0817 [Pyrococcus sp. ST04]
MIESAYRGQENEKILVTPIKSLISKEEALQSIYEMMEGCFGVSRNYKEIPSLEKPDMSLIVNTTDVYLYVYENASEILNAKEEIVKKLSLVRSSGFIFRSGDKYYLLLPLYIHYYYVLVLASGPREELHNLSTCLFMVGPSPGKVLTMFTPLAKDLEERRWLEKEGVVVQGYLEGIEGLYRGSRVALFIYRPDEGIDAYWKIFFELRKRHRQLSISILREISKNPAGRVEYYAVFDRGNGEVIYIELARFLGMWRVSIVETTKEKLPSVVDDLY